MPLYFKPHTPEWFRALEANDPGKAQISKMAIEFAGHAEVCSLCGDSPAEDYELIDLDMEADAVATIRLCDVCLGIKTQLYKEILIPFMPRDNPFETGSILVKFMSAMLVPKDNDFGGPRQRLEKLKELLECNLITEEEYERKRARILKDL